MAFAKTPQPPYYAVIFTSKLTSDTDDYEAAASKMVELVSKQEGFLGIESARDQIGITISYWKDLESIKKWKLNTEHLAVQEKGKTLWYNSFNVRICKIERDYNFSL